MSPQKMSVGHIPQNMEVKYTPVPPKSQSQLLLCPQTLPGDGNAMSRTQVKMGGSPQGRGKKRGAHPAEGQKGEAAAHGDPPPP